MTKNYKKQEKTASQIAISVLSAEERKCGVGRPAAPAPSHLASASTGARSSPHPHPGAARRITSSRTQASAAPREDDFAWLTARAVALADRVCGGRLVSVLEGGYQPQVLRRCVRAHVLALAGERA